MLAKGKVLKLDFLNAWTEVEGAGLQVWDSEEMDHIRHSATLEAMLSTDYTVSDLWADDARKSKFNSEDASKPIVVSFWASLHCHQHATSHTPSVLPGACLAPLPLLYQISSVYSNSKPASWRSFHAARLQRFLLSVAADIAFSRDKWLVQMPICWSSGLEISWHLLALLKATQADTGWIAGTGHWHSAAREGACCGGFSPTRSE